MKEGEMWRVIDGEPTQIIRWDNELIPITDPRTKEIMGQLALFRTIEETQ